MYTAVLHLVKSYIYYIVKFKDSSSYICNSILRIIKFIIYYKLNH